MSPKRCPTLSGSFLCLVTLLAQPALANSPTAEDSGEDELFRIGGSCAALAFLETDAIRRKVAIALGDELSAFCYPEEPFDCFDYSGFLKEIGTLIGTEDGGMCRLKIDD